MARYRLKLQVDGRLKWLSHLDLLAAMERALRRSGLPLAYSQGYNPHILISWGPAHPVGLASKGEFLDVDFAEELPDNWTDILNARLPEGLHLAAGYQIAANLPSLMADVVLARYELTFAQISTQALQEGARDLLAKESIPYRRISPKKTKEIDLRRGIHNIEVDGNVVCAELFLQGGPKPRELAELIAPDSKLLSVCRTAMSVVRDGVFVVL